MVERFSKKYCVVVDKCDKSIIHEQLDKLQSQV